jgi:hypothetical protein
MKNTQVGRVTCMGRKTFSHKFSVETSPKEEAICHKKKKVIKTDLAHAWC